MSVKKVIGLCAWLFILSLCLCRLVDAAGSAKIGDDERLKKAVEAVITFHEKSGNPELAGRIRNWYAGGHILAASKSMLNSLGLDMTGADPYYWSPTGTIYLPENSLLAAVNARGDVDFAAVAQLAGSMAHEMAHANDESMLSRAFLTSKAERELSAYTKTLQSYFSGAFKRNSDLLKKQGGPCDREGDAREINHLVGEFNRYFDAEIATKDSAAQKPMEDDLKTKLAALQDAERAQRQQLEGNAGYQSITKERDAILSEMGSLTSTGLGGLTASNPRIEALWAKMRENEKKRDLFIVMNPDLAQARDRVKAARDGYTAAGASYERYMGQDVRFPVADIRIPRLSYDDRGKASQLQYERDRIAAELQRLKNDPSHSNEVMGRISELGDRLYELDTQLESVTVAQARKELETLRSSMNTIIENCEKEKKGTKSAAAPKEDDLMNCLCTACGGMLGGYHSKLGDCAGGCTCWGPLSGWCTPVPTGEKHAKNCYGAVYSVKNPSDADVRPILEKARASNTRAVEAAIRKALKGNQLDSAFQIGKEAKKRDPGIVTPAFGELSGELKKQGWNALYKADYKTAIKRLEQAVEMNPADADAKKKLSDANRYAAEWPRIEAKAKEFDEYIAQKKIWSAHRSMLELQDILRPLAAGQSSESPLWKGVTTQMHQGLEWYNDFSRKSSAEWTRLYNVREWEQAEAHLKKVLAHELSPADRQQFSSSLQLVNSRLGEQRAAMQLYESAGANFAKGVPADANGLGALAGELKNREVHFNKTDPRRKQLDDLAAAMERRQKSLHAKAYAQTFFTNGDMYYRGYHFEPAVTQYTEGLRAIREQGDTSDPDYAKYGRLREDAIAKDRRFKELYAYAAGLAVTEKPLDEETLRKGIAAAEEALRIRPRNIDTEILGNKLKRKLEELQRARAHKQEADRKCEAKWSDGKALLGAGRHAEAIAKLRENLACAPGNRDREGYVEILADTLNRQEEAQARAAKAQRLRNEGEMLQNQGRYAAAIGRYKESVKLWPDPSLSAHIRQLEAEARKPPVREPASAPVQAPASASGRGQVVFDTGNIGSVSNNPTSPAKVSLSTPHVITLIQNYHWNDARGSRPGTIALRSSTGALYGPWQTRGTAGQGGVQNANWICRPNVTIPAGSYSVVDSDPSTWAQNSQSGGRGFTRIEGYPAGSSSAQGGSSPTPVTSGTVSLSSVTAEVGNASKENVHIFTEGETFSPANRLAPGEKRKVTVRLGSDGGVTFKAGRSGKVLATARWKGGGGHAGRVPVVTFDDSNPFGMLSVTTGLR